MIQFLQLQTNYEDWGIKTLLIMTIIALSGVITYLYKSKESAIKEKDDKILAVIKEHQLDLKDFANDSIKMAEKYQQFTESIKELVRNGRV